MFYLHTKFNTISSKCLLVLISNQKINVDAHGYQYCLRYHNEIALKVAYFSELFYHTKFWDLMLVMSEFHMAKWWNYCYGKLKTIHVRWSLLAQLLYQDPIYIVSEGIKIWLDTYTYNNTNIKLSCLIKYKKWARKLSLHIIQYTIAEKY
jgi:hypothetical protein